MRTISARGVKAQRLALTALSAIAAAGMTFGASKPAFANG
jgi:hypothetical protein